MCVFKTGLEKDKFLELPDRHNTNKNEIEPFDEEMTSISTSRKCRGRCIDDALIRTILRLSKLHLFDKDDNETNRPRGHLACSILKSL